MKAYGMMFFALILMGSFLLGLCLGEIAGEHRATRQRMPQHLQIPVALRSEEGDEFDYETTEHKLQRIHARDAAAAAATNAARTP